MEQKQVGGEKLHFRVGEYAAWGQTACGNFTQRAVREPAAVTCGGCQRSRAWQLAMTKEKTDN